ncbi:MAG TPA: DUF805 domain-containing protein [Hyphomicrobiaceae bacterium]|nr:DUF805 domain-containing protein [Hyphomicrobiaceae bacterium]
MRVSSAELLSLVRQLADPRGRCSRQAFLYVAVAFLALQVSVWALLRLAGIELSTMQSFLLNAPILLIGGTVSVKRVHDIGHRGWVMAFAFIGWLVASFAASFLTAVAFGPQAVADGGLVYTALFAVIMLPALGGLLWLHATPGMETANTFGPVPAEYGLSMPEAGYELGATAVTA